MVTAKIHTQSLSPCWTPPKWMQILINKWIKNKYEHETPAIVVLCKTLCHIAFVQIFSTQAFK